MAALAIILIVIVPFFVVSALVMLCDMPELMHEIEQRLVRWIRGDNKKASPKARL